MPRHVILGFLAGLATLAGLVLWAGLDDVAAGIGAIGWNGFAAVVGFHLGLIGLMGACWWLLGRSRPDARLWRFVWARWVRDSAGEALPLSQLGGFVIGGRALALAGVSGLFAAASTLVDLTIELLAKLPYTLLGLGLLAWLKPLSGIAGPVAGGIALLLLLAGLSLLVQRRGAAIAAWLAAQLARRLGGAFAWDAATLHGAIRQIHAARIALALAFAGHVLAWGLSGVEAWITLRLMGARLGLAEAIVIDSLLYGLRTFAFAIPGALGVQEAGYLALGAMFGLPPETALALSLLRRARDLCIGLPGVLAWQAAEARRMRRV